MVLYSADLTWGKADRLSRVAQNILNCKYETDQAYHVMLPPFDNFEYLLEFVGLTQSIVENMSILK